MESERRGRIRRRDVFAALAELAILVSDVAWSTAVPRYRGEPDGVSGSSQGCALVGV
jgi:hypothetical protein